MQRWFNKKGDEITMAERATLQIKDTQGTPDMVLVLTDNQELVLRGADILEREVEQAEQATAVAMPGRHLTSRLLKYLVTHQMEKTEQAIEQLAGGVSLKAVEEIGLDSSGLKIRLNLKWHGHALIHLDSNAIDWVEASTFIQQVDAARGQDAS